jgi:hypothetical protein
MPELHQILGSLFSDIAQSVFTSDLYSRDISRYYEQDGLLRHFPVPRTEISELDLDLKFAISEIELDSAQRIEFEANAATIFIDFSNTLSASFYRELHNSLIELGKRGRLISDEVLTQAASGVETIYLGQDLLRFFLRQYGSLIEDGELQVNKTQEEILEILRTKVKYLVGKELPDKDKKDLLNRINQAIHLKSGLETLKKSLRSAWSRAGDFRMEVEITADKLSELNSEQLSSVHVRTRVRNYKWSEVEHPGRRPWWTLNPE